MLWSILCTSIIKHRYIPSEMLDTTLTPIVKTKTCDVTDKNNYRSIAIATYMSNVMELLILSKTECLLNTQIINSVLKRNMKPICASTPSGIL